LGRAVGNWPEIREAIECLRGEHADSSLMKIVRGLAGEMIVLGGHADTPEEGRARAQEAIESGAALERFRALITAQGGDSAVVDDPDARADSAPVPHVTVPSGVDGYVTDLDALSVGQAAVELGAGRRTKEDSVDPVAGLSQLKKPGDRIQEGEVLARVHTSGSPALDAICEIVCDAYTFAEVPPRTDPPIRACCTRRGWEET